MTRTKRGGRQNASTSETGPGSVAGGSFARTGIPLPISTTAYNAANELTQRGTANLFYDLNGNMTSDGTNGFVWNARNQLASMNGSTNSFAYDPFGRRVSKTISGATTNYLYAGLNPVQELSGGLPTANSLGGLAVDEHFLRTDSAGARSFLTDPLGSTVALADSTGAIQTQYSYEPFGNTTVSGAASGNPYQYTGRENDSTGLYFYRARYYSPMFGRFISEDPIGFLGGGANLYAYVSDGPTIWVDPTGTDKKVCNDFDLKLRSLEFTLKLGPEIEAGPVDLGASIFKNITTGETGGEIEANLAGVVGGGLTRVNPPGASINSDASQPEFHAQFLGIDRNLTTGEPQGPSMSKTLGGQRAGIALGAGIEVSLNLATLKRLSSGCTTFVH